MKVVVDIDIPFIKGVLEPFAQVQYLKGREISPEELKDADALIVRTRTKCNEKLLSGSGVSFVASATIGTDHVDLDWLKNHNIEFQSAPGCNSGGVMQYVFTALYNVALRKQIALSGKTLGVIGVGNVGTKVAELGEHLGFRVLRNDPPKQKIGSDALHYCSLDELLEKSDIVTMHVPLDATTEGMANERFFGKMKKGAIFINSSRGEVVCDEALFCAAKEKLSALILDVWNGEPQNISKELVAIADIATPHIAGYSVEGKINGTSAVVRALARHFSIDSLLDFTPPHLPTPRIVFPERSSLNAIAALLLETFPIYDIDAQLRNHPDAFESIRSAYTYRQEFEWK